VAFSFEQIAFFLSLNYTFCCFLMPKIYQIIRFLLFIIFIISCKSDKNTTTENTNALFKLLSPEQTNITFQNTLTEGPNTNILIYEYFYNGGGVATADFNGDGKDDIYFTSNMGNNSMGGTGYFFE
jgi:enediyne biosynthesis protein E4